MSKLERTIKIMNNPRYGMTFNKEQLKSPKEPISIKISDEKYDLIFCPAIEEDDNGYIVSSVNLIHNNKMIGYCRFFYLPKENKEKYMPSTIYFLETIGHNFGLNKIPRRKDLKDIETDYNLKSKEEKIKTISSLLLTLKYSKCIEFEKNREDLSIEDLDILFEKIEKNCNKKNSKYRKMFDEKLEVHLDKPIIEFSFISNGKKTNLRHIPEEIIKYANSKNIEIDSLFLPSNINYRGKGLAKIMYKASAEWMARIGLKLYKGGTNHLSEPLWSSSFAKDKGFNLETEGERSFLNHIGIKPQILINNELKKKNKKGLKN